ncbi:MAG: glycoside hydrolase family 15 protein [Solirubrobacterales bacterium]|nr:glycoside hydrolase family 15 protein [Solirubrobacterales bacterium]
MPHPSPAAIGDLAFLSDCHTAALVDRGGTVCWWCPPRFDAGSVFGCLLGADAGHWSLRPVEPHEITRAYEPGSLVLRTTFTTASGTVDVLDALALTSGARGDDHGLHSPQTLLRCIEGAKGEVEMETVFAPRMEYGLTLPHTREMGGGVETWGGPLHLTLRAPFRLETEGGGARGRVTVRPGERVLLRAGYTEARADAAGPPDVGIEETLEGWRAWSQAHDGYDGEYADLVKRSALVLQGLTFRPTGAVVAAATTSLPEEIGGELNFDYRFAWLRDLSLTVRALWISTCADEAARLFGWIADAAGHLDGRAVQIVYRVEGERVMAEQTLDHLPGWADSAPVRVGNGAWDQRQLDVYGEVVDAAFQLRETLGELEPPERDLVVGLADRAAAEWMEPDSGLWEARDKERHYLSSKVLCWVALDRAVQMADALGATDRVAGWTAARDDIRAAIEDRGWCAERGAYGGAFDSDHLDASVLVMPLVGFCAASDERMRSTIEVIERELGGDGQVHRWEGEPHGFLICSFWLAECLALCGERQRAQEWFERAAGTANDLGLMAEMVDTSSGSLIGNMPQAFSHIGLINAAYRLTETAAAG